MRFYPVRLLSFIVLATCLLVISRARADWLDEIGYNALVSQQGTIEDGSGIDVSQCEAPESSGAYQPDPGIGQFGGKNFYDMSGGTPGASGHASNVGRVFFGTFTGIGGGITEIYNYEANHWLNFGIGYATGTDPLPHPYQVQNHSWIGNGIAAGIVQDLLQRSDFLADRENMTVVVGSSNGTSSVPQLMCQGYNSITVGRTDGAHGQGFTTLYGTGRVKPEIVVPKTSLANVTSYATPAVGSCAAILREAGGGAGGNQTNATQNETIKAMLLAGATKEEFASWDRTPTRPIDEKFGAGELNIQYSYNILLGGEFDAADSAPGVAAGPYGWDYSPSIANKKYYSFDVPNGATDVSILLTWNMDVVDSNPGNGFFAVPTLANMQIELRDSAGDLVDFSDSPVDNIEHIYLPLMTPGTYTLCVDSDYNQDYAIAWRMTPNPTPDPLTPDTFDASGFVAGGGLAEIQESDNQKLIVATGTTAQTVDVKAVSPTDTPIQFSFTTESSTRSSVPVNQETFLFNYVTSQYELVDTRLAQVLGDQVVTVNPTGDLSRFVEPGTNCIEARIRYSKTGLARGIRAFIDHVYWSIQ